MGIVKKLWLGVALGGLICLVPLSAAWSGRGFGPPGGSVGPWLFSDAENCARCHSDLTAIVDDEEIDISFDTNWGSSIMRFSFLDPFWRAKVRSESLLFPGLKGEIEKKCASCHAPMAYSQAVEDGKEIALFSNGGFLDPESEYHSLAMNGVGCTLCHQVNEPEGQESVDEDGLVFLEYTSSGSYSLSDSRVAWGRFYPDWARTMERASGYAPEQSDHILSSAFCAVCHDLHIDYYNEAGEQVNEGEEDRFPEQTPYLEWLASAFADPDTGKPCQGCHMGEHHDVRIASNPRQTRERDPVYSHTFFTENTMMLEIIDSIAEDDGIELPDLDEAVENGSEYLKEAGSIEIVEKKLSGAELLVKLRVTNEAGHKLPTSIPLRRVFIHFAVYEGEKEDGEVPLFSSGDTNEEGGIVGVDDVPGMDYSPHYDVITEESQAQVYEGVMADYEGEVTQSLTMAAQFKKDNRILPRGWDENLAPKSIWPVGVADDDNFVSGEDYITYRVSGLDVDPGQVFTIEAELKDQTLAYPMVQDMIEASANYEDETGLIETFLYEYDHHKVHFEIIDYVIETVSMGGSDS